MKNSKAGRVIIGAIMAIIFSIALYKGGNLAFAKITTYGFQSTMLNFKEINLDQADGDVIIFGDSLIQAMSPYAVGFKYVNMGVGGFTLNQVRDLLEASDIKKYKALIIEGGTNDLLGKKDMSILLDDYKDLSNTASKKMKFYSLAVIPVSNNLDDSSRINGRIKQFNSEIKKICLSVKGCTFIEKPNEMTPENTIMFMKDGVHLNKYGYELWTKAFKLAI
ncbi:hypothetical protein ELS78_21610 [Aeromonas veronii]|uniref:SGNH/GDSL hydrolase family protein n=1 Tax=Aeromonas veronii TaxID=654 RepID=UPI000F8D6602|nr:GDSL-type esterase/lipase family protein [Aeromonas veronii]RUR51997.1 hypothetical protein ELS78_21610 [Aeromonas veronii]